MELKSVWNTICHHGKILWKGFLRMVYGALTAGLFALSAYGFIMIKGESGWTAVCEFIASAATAIVALAAMYSQGGCRKRGARR